MIVDNIFGVDRDVFGEETSPDYSYLERATSGKMRDFGFVILSFTVGFKDEKYKCSVYFNNEEHPHPDGKRMSTNAELARIHLLGKWKQWWSDTLLPVARSIESRIGSELEKAASPVVKEWKKKRIATSSAWSRKQGRKLIASMVRGIDISHIQRDVKKFPTAVEFFSIAKNRLVRNGWTREMELEYQQAKNEEWIRKTFKIVRAESERNPELASIIADPFQYSGFFNIVIYNALSAIRDVMFHMFAASKSPDITDRTKQNRYRRKHGHAYTVSEYIVHAHTVRGYTRKDGKAVDSYTVGDYIYHTGHDPDPWQEEGPPLYEQGILANSIESKVERIGKRKAKRR